MGLRNEEQVAIEQLNLSNFRMWSFTLLKTFNDELVTNNSDSLTLPVPCIFESCI